MDLSTEHHKVTGLFLSDTPDQADLISSERVADFERDGFIFSVPMLSAEQISTLQDELQKLMDPSNVDTALFYEYNLNE